MANTVVRISDVPVSEVVTSNNQFLSFDTNLVKTRLVDSNDLKNYIANNLPYGIVGYYPGIPEPNTIIISYIAAWDISFASNMLGSKGICKANATSNTDFSILKNGNNVGTIRFVPSSNNALFLQSNSFTINTNDLLEVQSPETPDATLSHITITLSGSR